MVDSPEDVDRERGVLSPADRKYLLSSEKDRRENYSRQARSKRERAIRKRVKDAIKDFPILFEHLDEDDRKRIFSDIYYEDEDGHRWFPYDTYAAVIAFLYLGLNETHGKFDDILEDGIRDGERRRNPWNGDSRRKQLIVDYRGVRYVDMGGERLNSALDKLEDGRFNELTNSEAQAFIYAYTQSEMFAVEDVQEAMLDGRILTPDRDETDEE